MKCAVPKCRRNAKKVVYAEDPYLPVLVCDQVDHVKQARRTWRAPTTVMTHADWVKAHFPRPQRSAEQERDIGLTLDIKTFGTNDHVFKMAEGIIADLVTKGFAVESAEIIDEVGEVWTVSVADAVDHHQHGTVSG